MNRSFVTAALLASLLGACAETPASRPALMPSTPATPPVATAVTPADVPPATDGDVTTATVNGVQILVDRMPGAAFVSGQLYVRGGTRNWTADNAGIEEMAFRVAAEGGTTRLDKTAFSRRLAALGATIGGGSQNDFSSLAVKTPLSTWDDAFAILVDVFASPALPPSEIVVARTQMLAQLHHEQEDPEGQLWTLERKQIFAGHPYANRPIGTLESVAALKAQDLGPYLAKLREAGRLLWVVAGDVEPQHVVDQVRSAWGSLPRGSYVETPLPPLALGTPHLVTLERKLPTNYCQSVFPSALPSDPDWVAGRVAVAGYSFRLFQEVRSKRNLTYAVGAYINRSFATPFGVMQVSAVDPNAAMRVMLDEARKMQSTPVPDEELAGFKSVFLTGYLAGNETPDGRAATLGEAQLHGGDWHLARSVPDRVRAVTAADVQAYAKKYFGHLQAAVVGDPSKVDAALFTSL